MLVGWSLGRSVCHNLLKGRKVSLLLVLLEHFWFKLLPNAAQEVQVRPLSLYYAESIKCVFKIQILVEQKILLQLHVITIIEKLSVIRDKNTNI